MFTYLEKKNKHTQFFNLDRASLWGNIRPGLGNLNLVTSLDQPEPLRIFTTLLETFIRKNKTIIGCMDKENSGLVIIRF